MLVLRIILRWWFDGGIGGKDGIIRSAGEYCRYEAVDGGKSILVESVVQKELSLLALDARTGTLRWQISLGAPSCDIAGRCLPPEIGASEDHLYVLSRKQPYALQVFDMLTGKPSGQYPLTIPMEESLNLSMWGNDVLYIRASVHEGDPYSSGSNTSFTHYFIYAIRLTNGATAWKYDIGSLLDVQVPITGLLLAT